MVYEVQNVASATAPVRWTAALAYASVGSTTVGWQVVAGEALPEAVALALSFSATADARVEVFDALGRCALRADLGARAAGAARLDVSGLALGVYVVRLAAGTVRASTRVSIAH